MTAAGAIFDDQNFQGLFSVHIIPVIDLRSGSAVAACQGVRSEYQPLSTPLCPDGSALALVAAYRQLYGFRTIYIADLDAIEGTGNNATLIHALAMGWPQGEIWCDCGMVAASISALDPVCSDTKSHRNSARIRVVLGSESQDDAGLLRDLAITRPTDFILSLDFCGHRFLGPSCLEEDASSWPERVIVMTLDRVGTARGPGLNRLARFIGQAEGRRIYAAGGIRSVDDLKALASMGVSGALVATALHEGNVSPLDITALDIGRQNTHP